MKKIDAYRCQWCGKVYLTERGCLAHERKAASPIDGCKQHPNNKAMCYHCKHFKQETGGARVQVEIDGEHSPVRKWFYKCECKAKGKFLVNRFHLYEDWVAALTEFHGFMEMPTETEGCVNFKR